MKIKLNKEQVAYINGLDAPEAKQEFLLNCFLHQCEEKLEEKGDSIIFKDRLFKTSHPKIIEWLKNFDKGFVVKDDFVSDEFKQPMPKIKITSDIIKSFEKAYDSDEIKISCDEPRNYTLGDIAAKVAEFAVDKIEKENMLHFDLPKIDNREKFDKFIKDNGLNKFTPPELKNLEDIDSLLDRFNEKGLHIDNIIIKDGKEYNLAEMSVKELNEFAILEILNDSPSLSCCVEMKNYCAKIGEYELCAKFREKEKQLLEKTPPESKSHGYEVNYIPTNWKFLDDPSPINPDKIKKYTKEDLEKAFGASRLDIMGLPVFNNFEEYFRALE